MKKTVLASILALGLLSVVFTFNFVSAEEDGKIPGWVKGVFSFYADGDIDDDELIQGLQFLIKSDIIVVESEEETVSAAQCADTSSLQSKVTQLENDRKRIMGDKTVEEFEADREAAATSWGQAVYEASQECADARHTLKNQKNIVEEHVEAYWDEFEKRQELEKQVEGLQMENEELKAQIQELQN